MPRVQQKVSAGVIVVEHRSSGQGKDIHPFVLGEFFLVIFVLFSKHSEISKQQIHLLCTSCPCYVLCCFPLDLELKKDLNNKAKIRQVLHSVKYLV